jgi:hypothetical protein
MLMFLIKLGRGGENEQWSLDVTVFWYFMIPNNAVSIPDDIALNGRMMNEQRPGTNEEVTGSWPTLT